MPEHSMSIKIDGAEGRCVLDGVDITDAVLRDEITLVPGVVGWHVTLTLMVERLDVEVEGVDVVAREWVATEDSCKCVRCDRVTVHRQGDEGCTCKVCD